jgi:hypothetical protein
MHRFTPVAAIGAVLALLLNLGVSSTALADQRDFTLVNNTPGLVITHVFVSPTNVMDWGEDVLGRDVLPPGENVFIYFSRFDPASCHYDIKVLAEGGNEGVLTEVNLCETETVTFN